jgi:hypothetical protein
VHSEHYNPQPTKKRDAKTTSCPEVKDDATARNAVQLLPLSMLALRVTKSDPHERHNHAKSAKDSRRVKGLWTVKIEREEEFENVFQFAGDTAQTISHDSHYRFQDIKALFFYHYNQVALLAKQPELSRPRLFLLAKNYGSHQGILGLAPIIMDIFGVASQKP